MDRINYLRKSSTDRCGQMTSPKFSKMSWGVAVVVLLTIPACTQVRDGIIVTEGEHELTGVSAVLHIDIQSDHIIAFSVKDSDGSVVLEPEWCPSDVMKWSFYWDESEKILWMNSSDIGVYCWRITVDGANEHHVEELKASETSAPDILRDAPGFHTD